MWGWTGVVGLAKFFSVGKGNQNIVELASLLLQSLIFGLLLKWFILSALMTSESLLDV